MVRTFIFDRFETCKGCGKTVMPDLFDKRTEFYCNECEDEKTR